jgi:hypothetical protein
LVLYPKHFFIIISSPMHDPGHKTKDSYFSYSQKQPSRQVEHLPLDFRSILTGSTYIYSITFVCQNHLFVNNHSETQRASCNVKPNKHQIIIKKCFGYKTKDSYFSYSQKQPSRQVEHLPLDYLFVNNHSETQRASCNVKPNKHQTAVSSAVENCSVRAC